MADLGVSRKILSREEGDIASGIHRDVTGVARREERSGNRSGNRITQRLAILGGPHPGAVAAVAHLRVAHIRPIDGIGSPEEDVSSGSHVNIASVLPTGFKATVTKLRVANVVIAGGIRGIGRPLQGAELKVATAFHGDVALDVGEVAPATVTQLHVGILTTHPKGAFGGVGSDETDVGSVSGGADGDVPLEGSKGRLDPPWPIRVSPGNAFRVGRRRGQRMQTGVVGIGRHRHRVVSPTRR